MCRESGYILYTGNSLVGRGSGNVSSLRAHAVAFVTVLAQSTLAFRLPFLAGWTYAASLMVLSSLSPPTEIYDRRARGVIKVT